MSEPLKQPENDKKIILKDRIRKHIEDEKDVISEADLRNVEVGADAMSDQETEKRVEAEKEKLKNTALIDKKNSAWDILADD